MVKKRLIKGFLGFVIFLIILIFSIENQTNIGASIDIAKEKTVSVGYLAEKPVNSGYLGLLINAESNTDYSILPLTGSVTEVQPTSYEKAVAICGEKGFRFWNKDIMTDANIVLRLYQVHSGILLAEQSFTDNVFKPINLTEGELYLLRLVLSREGNEYFYDLPFYYKAQSNFDQQIAKVLNEIKTKRQENESAMGDIALTIEEVSLQGEITGIARDVIAIRYSSEFEYLDKNYIFKLLPSGEVSLQLKVRNKKRGKFDKLRKKIVLSGSGEWFEKDDNFVQIDSNEVYAGDGQQIYTLYRKDAINEDYLIDELDNLRFKGIGWKDDKFYFLGYGNFDSYFPQISNYRGVAFFEWNGSELSIPYFLEVDKANIDHYVNQHMQVDAQFTQVFWRESTKIFALDLAKHSLRKSELPLNSQYAKDLSIFYWQGEQSKKNQVVYWNDVRSGNKYTLFNENINRKILGVGKKGIYIGDYHLLDTFEYLNREVIYPFQKIVLYQIDGKEAKSLVAPKDKYFGTPLFTGSDKGVIPILSKTNSLDKQSNSLKVKYVKVGEQPFDYHFNQVSTENQTNSNGISAESQDYYNGKLYLFKGKLAEFTLNETKVLSLKSKNQATYGNYIVKMENTQIRVADFKQALLAGKSFNKYKIEYIENGKLLYDSNWLKSSSMIINFPLARQFPELPRGCEVTSLSMLLKYYNPKFPSHMDLARELTEYSKQKVGNQKVNSIDMKEAFAGSMYNFKHPGIGVYAEPITIIAKRYLGNRVYNITGSSLEQLLTFVSNGQPVQVIIGSRMNIIPESAKSVWHTNNGYMEVTYNEHSVVIVGFDDNYIYYANPSNGRIDKANRDNFNVGFEALGKQALVVVEE